MVWDDGFRSRNPDYEVVDTDGRVIGRIYRVTGSRERWFWGTSFQAIKGPPKYGHADTREEAMAAFKAMWAHFGN